GNSAFLIRVATALAARAAGSSSVSRSRSWVNVWLLAAASRASVSNSRPIVGSRSCLKWVLSSSVVTSAIITFLSYQLPSWRSRARPPGPGTPPGTRSGEEDTDRAPDGGAAQELVEPAQVGEWDLDSRGHGRFGGRG